MELKIQNITKRYRDKTAVDDVSITLTPGVWGLLGANGAGKTTLMRMLAGILRPSSGRILCDGVEIGTLGAAYREKLGYLPQEFGFYPEFTVQDYLEYMAALKGLPRTEAARQIDRRGPYPHEQSLCRHLHDCTGHSIPAGRRRNAPHQDRCLRRFFGKQLQFPGFCQQYQMGYVRR